MRAVTIVEGELIWQDHPDPVAGAGEVLVAVRAAGLNSADMIQRRGLYPAPPGSPQDIPGLELAGQVVAVGPGVKRFTDGDAVMAVVGGGAQAEMAVVHERCAMPVPPAIGWHEAGGFPEAFTTAHDALFTQCGLRMGERLCVHGAAGGVGLAAVQLGMAAGATVVATVRDTSLRDDVASFGASVVAPEDFAEHGPFDVVLELVGAPNMAGNMRALAVQGRIAVIGVGAGATTELDLLAVMQRRATIRGSTLRQRPLEEKATAARAVEREVLPLLADARVRVPVGQTFPMDEAAAAYTRFEAGAKLGKIVLVTTAPDGRS